MNIDLFKPIITEEKMHPAFIALKNAVGHSSVRKLMSEQYSRMGDSDGNFVKDFQSDGFHSRMFEIACFAYLESQGLNINKSFKRPDFIIAKDENKVAIEVVTSNPSTGRKTDIAITKFSALSTVELMDKFNNEFPIKIGSVLKSKVDKQYWLLPQCNNIPLVLIIGPFHEVASVFYPPESLARYLYGLETYYPKNKHEHDGLFANAIEIKEHKYGNKIIPSNFFAQPLSENISAVIYNNSWTVPKFLRIAIQTGLELSVTGIREGSCLFPTNNNKYSFSEFQYDVCDPDIPIETWWQSTTIFHNPNAKIPLPDNFFLSTSSYRYYNNLLHREVFEFHPLESFSRFSFKQ